MTNYDAGDVVLLAFPYTTGVQAKKRPALVLLDAGDADILVARVTTAAQTSAYDLSVRDWKKAGLLAPSVVRLHKLATLEKALVSRKLGHVTQSDWESVDGFIRQHVCR